MKVSNAYKQYKGKVVLDIPSFEFESGKIYAVIGANGSGKSTLGKVISKIIKSKVEVDCDDIAYMSQQNYAFSMSTLKNVLLTSNDKKKDLKKAKKYMERLDIWSLRKQNASKLSGGETAKMALARILLKPREVLILDEPTAAMDVNSTISSEELISIYHKENKNTIILITHSISQAERLADTVIFMNDGRIEEVGSPKQVLSSPKSDKLKSFIKLS